ncbi:translation initiation factor IF-2 subunit gamma [Candidatus Woesearchaeota archaeon]|nr:translation initiation factor IF-2 subunit gamma [Candidatus Woesearchaeota archaeon]
MSNQPEINLGIVGHVDHGKTTLTEQLTGKWTDTHSEELKRGITIRLGYANFSVYKTKEGYTNKKIKDAKMTRIISIVDAPGHETLMATMLSGAAIMDGALLLIAANEECPQPQTKEHLMALEIIGINQIVIVQNKVDLVSKEQSLKNYKQIKEFVKGTVAENAPIIPISAQHGININFLIEAIEDNIKTPKRDVSKNSLFYVARSFDVNKPGSDVKNIMGGVLGGAVKQGIFKLKDKIEINPGLKINDKYVNIKSEIIGLMSGNDKIEQANPGGSIAILTDLDPSIVKSDSLTGNVVSMEGKAPEVFSDLSLEVNLLKRVVGTREDLVVEPIKKNESLVLNVNAAVTIGEVVDISKKGITVRLKIPVCASHDDRVAVSRKLGNRWRLIGVGIII